MIASFFIFLIFKFLLLIISMYDIYRDEKLLGSSRKRKHKIIITLSLSLSPLFFIQAIINVFIHF